MKNKLPACYIVFLFGENMWLPDVYCTKANIMEFKRLANYSVDEWYRTVTVRSGTECCSVCAHDPACHLANYAHLEFCCHLSNTSRWYINGKTDGGSDVFVRQDWDLVFRGTPGTATDPYISYRDAVDVTTNDISCQQITPTDCSQHYRNPIVDDWENLHVSQVKYSFYKNGKEAAYVIFDGVNSTSRSWYKPELILESSWPDMIGQTFDSFSMAGYTRRFVMNTILGGTCERSWTYSVAVNSQQFCGLDMQHNGPHFIYTLSDTASRMSNSSAFALAECIAFYVK